MARLEAKPAGTIAADSGNVAALLPDWDQPLLLIGCGNMAGAMLARWLDAGLSPALVEVVDPARPTLDVTVHAALPDTIRPGSHILLGIKPQHFDGIAANLSARMGDDCTVLTIMAGLPLSLVRGRLPRAGAIVRLMPNLPVRTGEGIVLTYAEGGGDMGAIARLLAPLGLVESLPSEAMFDLGTALTGCGPAYVYRFIDTLASASAALGLEKEQAARLALRMVAGAAAAAARSGQQPAAMADAVASPGGMTREGLDVLDADGRLAALMTDMLRAARDKGAALAAATSGSAE